MTLTNNCPSDEILAGLVHGVALGDGSSPLRAHVDECVRCRDWIEEANEDDAFVRELRSGDVSRPRAADQAVPRLETGEEIGSYAIIRHLADGGMGEVYLAEQRRPVRRVVALKVIKLGMDTREVIARFQSERQALALMNHPNIAAIHEAGVSQGGRPYFAMEYVDGERITDYCDRRRLTIRQRLELFMQVCDAVQHAHQKAVIHRDLKPSNVLVSELNGRPVPKVIDFGVAKAVSPDGSSGTRTAEGCVVGTLEYMSPEQAGAVEPADSLCRNPAEIAGALKGMIPKATAMSAMDIDTRSDIYSLGVMLYELLTGLRPLELESTRRSGSEAIRRVLREIEPQRPSVRVTAFVQYGPRLADIVQKESAESVKPLAAARANLPVDGASPVAQPALAMPANQPIRSELTGSDRLFIAAIAERRGMDARRLSRQLKGDLDWITLKCLEKNPSRRYATANALATDLKRFLNLEAISARPPSAFYQFCRFARRNRTLVVALVVVVLALVLGAAIATWQSVVATRERNRALKAERTASAQLAFLKSVLTSPDPNKGARNVLLLDNLTEAAKTIGQYFVQAPEAEAAARDTLGQTLRSLGIFETAEVQIRPALEIRNRELGELHPDTLTSLDHLGRVLADRKSAADAQPLIRRALELRRKVMGDRHPDTLASLNNWASIQSMLGKHREAELLCRQALEGRSQILGDAHEDTISTLNNLASNLSQQGRYAEASKLLQTALDRFRLTKGVEHPRTLVVMGNLATAMHNTNRFAEAEELFRQVWELQKRIFGLEHPTTLTAANNLATTLLGRPKIEEAEGLCRDTLETRRRVLSEVHLDTLKSKNLLGKILMKQKRFVEAVVWLREAYETGAAFLPPGSPEITTFQSDYKACLARM